MRNPQNGKTLKRYISNTVENIQIDSTDFSSVGFNLSNHSFQAFINKVQTLYDQFMKKKKFSV